VGPHRYYVKLARFLADSGYVVFRYDPLGIGESDGRIQKGPTREIWQSIETGRYVEDTLLAATYFRREYGLNRIAAGGICGAAVTALLAAVTPDAGIDGVISINTAVSLSTQPKGPAHRIGTSQADHNFRSYVRKIFSLEAWKRVVTGESDFSSIRNTLVAKTCNLLHLTGSASVAENERINMKFLRALRAARKHGIKHLLVFSGNDSRWFEFRDMILAGEPAGRYDSRDTQISVINDANHELHLSMWQEESMRLIRNWLGSAFGSQSAQGL
jgi:pimeloyl-ACP methyl ester carboxylesterase